MNNEKLRATIRNIVNTWHWNRNEQVVELLNRCYVALGEQASVPDDEAVMAKARELFGWAYGLGGFSDAVRDLVAFAHPASASSAGGESMKDLPNKLHIKATMIELGERIAWGSETALMHEAADKIEALGAELAAIMEQSTARVEHILRLEAEQAALKSAPVVMPNRMTDGAADYAYARYSAGWNACLDEFARLNGGKP